jgi:hypothetical protein
MSAVKEVNKKELARTLHDKFCDRNHIDQCSWGYEKSRENMWEGHSHGKWLERAKSLMEDDLVQNLVEAGRFDELIDLIDSINYT